MESQEPLRKRHHLIPKFYLERFTAERSQPTSRAVLWQYDRERDNPVIVQPNDATVRTHFYTITDRVGNRTDEFEKLLQKLEDESAPVIRRILSKEGKPQGKDAEVFAAFVASTFLRTAYFRERLNTCVETFLNDWIKDFASDENEFNAKYLAYESERQGKLDIPASELRQQMLTGKHQISANKSLSFWMFTSHVEKLAGLILQMRWAFLSSTTAQEFLTSDNPVVVLNPNHPVTPWHAGLAQKDAEVTLPLSSRMSFIATWSGPVGFLLGPSSSVRNINKRTACAALRFVFSPFRGGFILEWFKKYPPPLPPIPVPAIPVEHEGITGDPQQPVGQPLVSCRIQPPTREGE